jgi:2,4-dienoyl-CoA reductase-like NADH-dependent reductase (Old Yellow Enzyme family)
MDSQYEIGGMAMSKLFETIHLKSLTLANRFVRSATWEGMADSNGFCTPKLIALMKQFAEGGVGLIITGFAFVSKEGRAAPWQMGADGDAFLSGLKEMTDAVHRSGGKIVLQIVHGGCYSATQLTGQEAIAPSTHVSGAIPRCREMTVSEIGHVVAAFGESASLAKKAGFDGVQIHAAHGYLLSQFLSPYFNKRKDAYGGSIGNRARIVLETLQSVRRAVGTGYPVMIKVNSEDFVEGGLTVDEMLLVAGFLEEAGIDAIEMSGGTVYASGAYSAIRAGALDTPQNEVFYREAAIRYKEKISVPLMLVGGIRSFTVAEKLINDGLADYISLSRPLIREPTLINRWKSGDLKRATCISDNACFGPVLKGEGLYCVREPAQT